MEINANVITADEGVPVVIGFADNSDKPKNYVLLSYDPAEKDEGLYIEVNDQQRGGYKLVQRVQLADSSAHIKLTPAGEQILDIKTEIRIAISPRVTDWRLLKTKLAELLSRVVPVETS